MTGPVVSRLESDRGLGPVEEAVKSGATAPVVILAKKLHSKLRNGDTRIR